MLKENLELGNIGLKLKLFNPFFLVGDLWQETGSPVHEPCPLHFSRLYVVPKKDGPNLLIDLSFLNTLLVVPTFKMERISEIASGIVHPMWGCMVDLKYAFYHVTMAWAFHVFLAFVVDGQTYVFQVMPFGLSVAPWAFSKNTKPIKSHLHILLYLFTPVWTIFSLPHPGSLWLFRLHTSFLFSNNLVSGYTSPSHNLLRPRWSST